MVFLNPLKISILGAQVASAKRILCHKTAITIKVGKKSQFHGFGESGLMCALSHLPFSSPGRGEGAGRAVGDHLGQMPLAEPFLRVLHLRERKEIEIPPQIPAGSFEDPHISQGLKHSLKCPQV